MERRPLRTLNFVRPFASAMLDEEDFDLRVCHAIGDDVWRTRENEFSCAFDLAVTPQERIGGKKPWVFE
ncbi:hypothetical protein LCM4573_15510 [Rhizobium sp. LCM 4573]|nr:hypothetical protein LCM4573_15510 [Rhizobium sp. LCM 4573]